jgi:transcriptional regulator with XRE-family HTH domain
MVGIFGESIMKKINKRVPSIPAFCSPFGLFLFRYIEYKNMRQQEVAKKVGIEFGTIRSYMNGSRYPKLCVYMAICEVLSDTREEYNYLLLKGFQSTPENELALRRLRSKEKRKK